jgi:hypothetical protein
MSLIWNKLAGTLNTYFRIGLQGVRLKDSSGNLVIRNSGDSADADLTAKKVNVSGADLVLDSAGNALTVSRNGSQSGALQIILPSAKATDGQVLAQKAGTGAGIIEFEFVSAGSTSAADKLDTTSLAFDDTSPVAMFDTGASDVIEYTDVVVDDPFDGAPAMSVGIAGTASKYVASTDVDLTAAAGTVFRIPCVKEAQGAESLIITYSAGGASQGAARVLVHYATPT